MNKYFVLGLCVFSSNSLIPAMNLPLNQAQQSQLLWTHKISKSGIVDFFSKSFSTTNTIQLTCTNGMIHLPIEQTQQCTTLKNCLDFKKGDSFKYLGTLHFSIEEIHDLFDFMHKKCTLGIYTIKQINRMLDAADYLEAPQDIRHTLATYLLIQTCEYDVERKKFLLKNCYRSPKILAEHMKLDSFIQPPNSIENGIVNLSSMRLQSLEGLDELFYDSERNQSVHILDVRDNQLHSLDLAHIISAFPHVKNISAQNNSIQMLSTEDISALKHNMELELQNNKISMIEPCKRYIGPSKALINLTGNPLSSQALENLYRSLQLSKYQKEVIPWTMVGSIAGSILGFYCGACHFIFSKEKHWVRNGLTCVLLARYLERNFLSVVKPYFQVAELTLVIDDNTSYIALKKQEQEKTKELGLD